MRIIIVGAGEVGYSVAKDLSDDGHDIIVVEEDETRVSRLENDLDVIVIKGNGARPSVLERAGLSKKGKTDISLLIACTNKDEVNIMACWIAKKMGVPHVIARAVGLEFTDNEHWARDLGIDMLISPERSVVRELEELLEVRGAMHATEIAGGKAGIYAFRIANESPVCGLPLSEVRKQNPDLITTIVCIQRDGASFVPKGDDTIEPGDVCYSMCYRDQARDLEMVFQPTNEKRLSRVFVIGGGKIGYQISHRLITHFRGIDVRLFEEDREKSERIAAELPKALVICGDGADADLLASEGISEADGFIAATDQDEKNLMLSVLGKTLGASKSIAIVKRSNYLGMTNHIPVDSIVDRNQALANVIIKNVRYQNSSGDLTILDEIDAEAIEITLSEDSPAVGKKFMEIKMPAGSVAGIIQRNMDILIPVGTTQLMAGDKVTIFASSEIMPLALRSLGEPVQ
ncbi:MAG: Trk system potassium transporter TrkA [Synergistaceae bacterium]|nr:Trk system potassium transporter TrkA [Synergistaceae bacterium]